MSSYRGGSKVLSFIPFYHTLLTLSIKKFHSLTRQKEKQELDKSAKFLYNGAIIRSIAFVADLTVFEARGFPAAQMTLLLVFAQ